MVAWVSMIPELNLGVLVLTNQQSGSRWNSSAFKFSMPVSERPASGK
jgi:hypothetical protein